MPNKKELAEMAAEAKAEAEMGKPQEPNEDGSFHIGPSEIQRLNEDLILDRPRSLD
jgi:hypothetical protein